MERNKLVLVILALWCLGLTICLGFAIHELLQTKEQAVVAQSVSAKVNKDLDKWARDYYYHIRFHHEQKEK